MDTNPVYEFLASPDHDLMDGVWRLEVGEGEDRIAPDTRCEIIFHLAEPPLEKTATDWIRQPARMIYGPLTRVLELGRTSPMSLMAIRLKPHAIGALTEYPREFRNRSSDLTALFSTFIIDELSKAAHVDLQYFSQTAQSALKATGTVGNKAARVAEAVEVLELEPAMGPLELATRMIVSRRTLDRNFMRHTGLTPGEFLQIHRYHAARKAIRAGAGSLSAIAQDAGYADQAHMTREFRRFAGKTPRHKRGDDPSDIFYDEG